MGDPTIIPPDARAELCQMALDAQAACLAAFDAIEAGDLVPAVVAVNQAVTEALALNTAVKPLAALALMRIESGLGVKFGAPHG